MIDCAVALVGDLCAGGFGQRPGAVSRVARFVGFPQIWATINMGSHAELCLSSDWEDLNTNYVKQYMLMFCSTVNVILVHY